MNLFDFDEQFYAGGSTQVAGVDEAGRGPWAGPVVAAAVALPRGTVIEGLNDSKKLSAQKREKLFEEIKARALSFSIEVIDHSTIDSLNILSATYLGMRRAIGGIAVPVDMVLVDGWEIPELARRQTAFAGGDAKSASIAAASILAKVTRDSIMTELSAKYPQYNFGKHKGYGTKEHRAALLHFGPCEIHRKTFSPVKDMLTRPR
ncbi:MAG: ribonuclease HII [Endomicrobiales bacterium]|nr:ribonuclease HII [Endomicrobiales bacterium]